MLLSLVLYCIEQDKAIEELSLEELKKISPVFEEDIYDAVSLETCVNKRVTIGAPGKEAMEQVIIGTSGVHLCALLLDTTGVSTTQCIRVPVLNGHTAAVFVKFAKKPTKEQLIEKLINFRGLPQELELPSGLVGRSHNFHRFKLFPCGQDRCVALNRAIWFYCHKSPRRSFGRGQSSSGASGREF